MRNVRCIIAAVALAGTVGSCADPYYPRYGTTQGYYHPAGYSAYPAPSYSYYPPPYAYRPATWSDYRNYRGIHPSAEATYP